MNSNGNLILQVLPRIMSMTSVRRDRWRMILRMVVAQRTDSKNTGNSSAVMGKIYHSPVITQKKLSSNWSLMTVFLSAAIVKIYSTKHSKWWAVTLVPTKYMITWLASISQKDLWRTGRMILSKNKWTRFSRKMLTLRWVTTLSVGNKVRRLVCTGSMQLKR